MFFFLIENRLVIFCVVCCQQYDLRIFVVVFLLLWFCFNNYQFYCITRRRTAADVSCSSMYDFIFMIIIITFVDIVNCVERGILTHSATKQKADNDIISRKNPQAKKKNTMNWNQTSTLISDIAPTFTNLSRPQPPIVTKISTSYNWYEKCTTPSNNQSSCVVDKKGFSHFLWEESEMRRSIVNWSRWLYTSHVLVKSQLIRTNR